MVEIRRSRSLVLRPEQKPRKKEKESMKSTDDDSSREVLLSSSEERPEVRRWERGRQIRGGSWVH